MPLLNSTMTLTPEETEYADSFGISEFGIEGVNTETTLLTLAISFGKARPDLTDPLFPGVVEVIEEFGTTYSVFRKVLITTVFEVLTGWLQAGKITQDEFEEFTGMIGTVAATIKSPTMAALVARYVSLANAIIPIPARKKR